MPVHNDQKIFEFLTLEIFQAGLSWRTVLHKRKHFCQAFARFDFKKIARFGKKDRARLLRDKGIIRNRLKIDATIHNARRFIKIRKEFGTFAKYMWAQVDGKPMVHRIKGMKDYPQFTKEAVAWSDDLKKRGFKFLGPTVVYAHMQAVGMVNDHTVNCFRYQELGRLTSGEYAYRQ